MLLATKNCEAGILSQTRLGRAHIPLHSRHQLDSQYTLNILDDLQHLASSIRAHGHVVLLRC